MKEEKGYWSGKTDESIIKKLIKVSGMTIEELEDFKNKNKYSWDVMYQMFMND